MARARITTVKSLAEFFFLPLQVTPDSVSVHIIYIYTAEVRKMALTGNTLGLNSAVSTPEHAS